MAYSLKLYLVASKGSLDKQSFLHRIKLCLEGGVDIIQLREKELNTKDFYELAFELKKLCKEYKKPLIINDRLDIALAIDADGLHIGQEDLPLKKARMLLGKDKILGLSVSSFKDLKNIDESLVDYLGIGAIYSTPTKKESKAIGIEGLKALLTKSKLDIVVIGGIEYDNLKYFKGLKIAGFAVVRALMQAKEPFKEAKKLKEKIKEIIN